MSPEPRSIAPERSAGAERSAGGEGRADVGRGPGAPILSVEGLRKSYGTTEVLKGIDVGIEPGDFLVLVGPSGCGKSTLLNCIAGLEEATGGTIRIKGRDVTHVPPRDRDIAMVFQSYALYPTMSVGENISFGMRIRGKKRAEYEPRVREVARVLQIEHLLERPPSQLSGGQRQRVAMGRALVRDPALFLFDEPLSNLDAKLRVEMRAEIKQLHERLREEARTAIVYVTHDQIEALTLATRIVVLEEGVVRQVGTPAEIYDRPANAFVAAFMGSPSMNLLPARLEEDGTIALEDGIRVEGPRHIADAASTSGPGGGLAAGAELTLGVRPEAITLAAPDAAGAIPATSLLVENAGSDAYVALDVAGTRVTVRQPGRSTLQAGERVGLLVAPDAMHMFDRASGDRIGP